MAASETFQSLKTEIEDLRNQLRSYMEYDSLTGLYNRETFYTKTEDLLRRHPNGEYDIVCVDVQRFKLVNDLFGSDTGDDLLKYLAEAFKETFGGGDGIIARMYNDVFAMCLPGGHREETERTILKIFRGYPLDMSVVPAIGFYGCTDRGQRVSLMCDWAMLALKSIKGDYSRYSAVYDSDSRSRLLEEQEILDNMEAALEGGEFEVYVQPKCNMRSGRIVGAEALVRWNRPGRGLLSPGIFLPVFERNGFIKKMDIYVWEKMAAWQRGWIDAGHRPLPISVNLSRIDIYEMDVCGVLEDILKKYRLDPQLLELEVTESAYVKQPEKINRTMERLMRHGFTILMDDFGSGYSSLNMLSDINVNVLKIDMRFLERDDKKSRDILESVVHMSKWLNLPVIAEGVETERQVDFLLDVSCIYAQGYFFYRPMPLEEYVNMILREDCVDYEDGGKYRLNQERLLDFHDLFHKDVMSDRLLGNILGAIALFDFDGSRFSLLKGTGEYYRITGSRKDMRADDIFERIRSEDRPALLEALCQAKQGADESGVEVFMRWFHPEGLRWLKIRLFHLAGKPNGDVFYGALSDVTEHMEQMEQLRISEERFCLAMEATNIVLFELDVKTREAHYSEYTQKVFNLDAMVANAPEGFIEQGTVCEESQEDFRAVYDAIYHGAERASCIIHARIGDGALLWNRVTLTAIKDKAGGTVNAVGMVETVCREQELPPELLLELEHQTALRKDRSGADTKSI